MIRRFEQIKEHFEKEASLFDSLFFKVMPGYREFSSAMTEAFPFPRSAAVDIIDLGCGTGNLALRLAEAYPRARLTCVDMAENMLMMARAKLKGRDCAFRQADILGFDYGRYDAIVASMVLHHVAGSDKPAFYRRLRKALKPGGVFFAIDIFIAPDRRLQRLFMDKWKAHMRANGLSAVRVNEMIRRHQREDRPVRLTEELGFLAGAGFSRVEVVKKDYNFALYGGMP